MKTANFNSNDLVRANVAKLKPYSSARDEYVSDGTEMIFLDANENPYENGVNRYPDPQQRILKQELAKIKGVNANQLLLGNGSDEVLDLIFRAFCEPSKDNVITLPPTYGMYRVLANINAVEEREVMLTSDFEPDVEAVLKAVDGHTKLIFLCSPNNPTGNNFDKTKIKAILENFHGLVVVDEAYIDFAAASSWIAQLTNHPNLIITQTLSKAYGMAGIRLGICYASAAIIGILNKIKPPYNVNALTQRKALERVVDGHGVQEEISAILKDRTQLITTLEQLHYVSKIFHTDANFVLVKVDDANKRYQQLLERGIVIRNRTTQPLCENTLRFTVGNADENQQLIKVLKDL